MQTLGCRRGSRSGRARLRWGHSKDGRKGDRHGGWQRLDTDDRHTARPWEESYRVIDRSVSRWPAQCLSIALREYA